MFPFLSICQKLHILPLKVPLSLLQPILAMILQQQAGYLPTFVAFTSWLVKESKISLQKLPKLRAFLNQIQGATFSGNTSKEQLDSTFASSSFTSSFSSFTCQVCTTPLPTSLSALLHLAEQSEKDCNLACSLCNLNMGKARAGNLKEVMETQAVLEMHLTNKQHIAAIFGEVGDGETTDKCDACDVVLATNKDMLEHVGSKKHKQAVVLVEEYLKFCKARSLLPTSHRNFPSFVFFLRF